MILSDTHTHTNLSGDCISPAEEMLSAAVGKGLKHYTITDHLDIDYPECGVNFLLDMDAYLPDLDRIVADAPKNLQVLKGIEFGLMPYLQPELTALGELKAFDYILGSCHLAYGEDPYDKRFYAKYGQTVGYRRCFEAILECVVEMDGFDSLGHLDYAIRYWRGEGSRLYEYKDYQTILDPILETLIKKEIALEVNTGGYLHKLNQPNPGFEVLQRYYDLGGELLTIGSDAHVPANVASHFDVVEEQLKSIGFKSYTTFINRRPLQLGFE